MKRVATTRTGLPILAPEQLRGWLARLLAAYPTAKASPELKDVYEIGLADLTAGELDIAFTEALKLHRGKFAPSPADLRGYLREAILRVPPQPSPVDPDCEFCRGGGFELRGEGDGKFAVPCRCRRKQKRGGDPPLKSQ